MPVYQDKKNKTKDGRTYYFKCQYTDIFGETRTKKSKKYFSSREAKEEERKFLENSGKIIQTSIIWNDLVKDYIKNIQKKDTTLYSKFLVFNKYGNLFNDKEISKINKFKAEQIRNYIDTFNIATKTKNRILGDFKLIFKYAIETGKTDNNPFELVKKFQDNPNKIKDRKKESDLYLTPEEFNDFISVIDNDFWKIYFSFAFYMGTRKGEQAGLQWKDIDFENNKLTIYKQLNLKGLTKENRFIPTKNNVIRTISIPNKLMEMLNDLYEKEKKVIGFNDEFLVFGGIKHTSYTTIDRQKKHYFDLLEAQKNKDNINNPIKVKRITMHQFRHSHASFLISNNVPVNIIAKRLGDTIEVVLKTYAHLFPDVEETVIPILNKI